MKKPGIPNISKTATPDQAKLDRALKETIETITGVRGDRIKPLAADAGLSAVIAKVNEILGVLQ